MKKSQLSTQQIQEIIFEIVVEFAEFCKKHNLRYSVCGGSAIGAIRHKNFIPWDDDFDVIMPRNDYNFFISHFVSKRLFVKKPLEKGYYYPFAKIYHAKYVGKEIGRKGKAYVWIDIFPVDKVKLDDRNFKKYMVIERKLLVKGQSYPQFLSYMKGLIGFFQKIKSIFEWVLANVLSFKHYYKKLAKLIDENPGDDYYWLVWNPSIKLKIIYNFDKLIPINFNNLELLIVEDYDDILKKRFGNYLVPPPVSKRVGEHNFILLDK